ncbi:MAG: SusC/RagA family TonB-linked outer membrane protein [Flavitalea sp.]
MYLTAVFARYSFVESGPGPKLFINDCARDSAEKQLSLKLWKAKKTLRIMKLTAIILLAACLQVSAKARSQQITLSQKNASLEKVFREIRKQTGFYFFYDLKELRDARPVSISVRNASLEETLMRCFQDQPFTFTIINKTVVIKPRVIQIPDAPESIDIPPPVEIKGKITNDKGEPLSGATIQIKNLNKSVTSNGDGFFSIEAPSGDVSLVISFVGYLDQTISVNNQSFINVSMSINPNQLSGVEVVVTALGRTREKRALGYSVQQIGGDDLTLSKSVDPSASLAGKIAGIQVTGAPSSTFDRATIIIRGVGSLAPGNPLYVLDGTPTDQSNVIMDNVESISVLKGAAATALYGNRATNGVILITSKKGSRKAEPVVELNLGTSIENVYLLPPYQNEYAAGNRSLVSEPGSTYDAEGFEHFSYKPGIHPASWAPFDGQRLIEYSAGNGWGPKINGQEYRPYYSWYPGEEFGKVENLTAYKNNPRDFFETGRNLNNSISISGGGDKFVYRVTYANQNRTLTMPGSNRNQNQIGINTSYDVSKKLTIMTDIAYTANKTKGDPYRRGSLNVTHQLNNYFQRQLDVSKLKNYRNADGSLNTWNIGNPNVSGNPDIYLATQDWENPYFIVNEDYNTEKTNRLIGNLGFNYKFNDIFSITSYARLDQKQGTWDNRTAAGGLDLNAYELSQYIATEANYEINLNFKKKFSDFSLEGLLGGNVRTNRSDMMSYATEGGLTFPNYFDISASVSRPSTSRILDAKKVRSVYGKASVGYKNFLYLDATLRNDWSSALPQKNNSYLYPSLSSSFVFTELMGKSKTLTFGKLRASYAQVGSDLGFNQVNIDMITRNNYINAPSAEIGDQYRSGNILPTLTRSWEIGTELRFFNRIGLDIAYYHDDNINQIIGVPVAPASGYLTAQINAGNIQRKGIEISLSATPVRSKDFSWNTVVNFSRASSMVKALAPGIDQQVYYQPAPGIFILNRVGKKWGTMIGREFDKDAEGRYIFKNLLGERARSENHEMGSVLPDFTGGWFNSLTYKNFDLSFSLDFQIGGLIQSQTMAQFYRNGEAAGTTGVNDKGIDIREFPSAGGGIRIDGAYNGEAMTIYVPAQRYFNDKIQDSRFLILDATYVKLREVRFGYTIPSGLLSRVHVKNANIGLMVNNAWLIYSPMKDVIGLDPSESGQGQGNGIIGYQGGQLSSSRSIGVNLKVTF